MNPKIMIPNIMTSLFYNNKKNHKTILKGDHLQWPNSSMEKERYNLFRSLVLTDKLEHDLHRSIFKKMKNQNYLGIMFESPNSFLSVKKDFMKFIDFHLNTSKDTDTLHYISANDEFQSILRLINERI